MPDTLSFRDVTFRYESAQDYLFSGLTVYFSTGFTGIVGPNGGGKTTLLQLASGLLVPDAGTIDGVGEAVYCAQRTDKAPEALYALLEDTGRSVYALRGRLGIEDDYLTRWDTLSHGERKRAQIGCALWQRPGLLAIDEPTNHIDAVARDQLVEALGQFQGIGLIVSHDRTLLDDLCRQCLWLEPPESKVYQGGYTSASAERSAQRGTAIANRSKAIRQKEALRKERIKRREHAEKAQRQQSKRGVDAKDHDAKEKINHAKLTNSGAGKRMRQLDGRLAQAETTLAQSKVRKEYEVGIWLPGSFSRRSQLFSLPAGEIALGETRTFRHPALIMQPQDRIALTGANGLGKSTLLTTLLAHMNVPEEHLTYMPQEISAEESEEVLEQAKKLPREQLGHVMNVVSRLGSRPARLLESELPSPGEIRKLLLALGMSRLPHLLVLDEPTNHLDLPSVEALESALAGCPCGLLLVSHDQRFLDALATVSWHVESDQTGNSMLIVR